MHDISDRELAEPATRGHVAREDRRGAILEVVANAAQRFLAAPSNEEQVGAMLGQLGEAAGVDRVVVCQNRLAEDGRLFLCPRYQWVRPGLVDPPGERPFDDVPYDPDLLRWEQLLGGGEVVHGNLRDLPSAEVAFLAPQRTVSTAFIPVFAGEHWWGAIGIGSSTSGMEWSLTELEALRAVAGVLGAAVHQHQAETALRETEDRYRRLVESSPDAIVVHRGGVISFANPAAGRLVGAGDPADLIGRSVLDFVGPESRAKVLDRLQRLREGRSVPLEDEQFLRLDGSLVDVEVAATPFLVDGQPAVQIVARDITDRRRAEEAMRQSEARKSSMLQSALDAIVTMDHLGHVLEFNPAAEQIFGRSRGDVLGREMADLLIPPALRARHREGLARYLVTGKSSLIGRRVDAQAMRADGSEFPVELTIARVDVPGPALFTAYIRDITERRQTELALTESEDRYRRLVERSPMAIAIHAEGKFVFVNDAAVRLLGAGQPSDIIGRSIFDVVHPDFWDLVRERAKKQTADGMEVPLLEEKIIRIDGQVIDVEVAGMPFTYEGKPAGQIVIWDITRRKRAEQQLSSAEAKYRTLVERIPAITYTAEFGETAPWLYVSPQIEAILGFTPEEWMVRPNLWSKQVHPQDRDRILAQEVASRETGHPMISEYRLVAKDGQIVWVRDECVVVAGPAGEPLLQGVMLDITERKHAEELLREAEGRYRTLVEQIPAITYIDGFDEAGTFTGSLYYSPQIEGIFGYTPEELIFGGDDLWASMLHPEDRDRVLAAESHHFRSKEPLEMEYRALAKDGRLVWVLDEAVVVTDSTGRARYSHGILYDITDRKKVEENLERGLQIERQATERLRALDEMKNTFLHAVSHELRTPLAAVLGFALTLEREEVQLEDSERRAIVQRLAVNARKLDQLLSDLLDLDRLDRGILEPRRKPTDVASLVRRVVENSEVLGTRPVRVETQLVVTQLDGPKVERIVENLLVNAARHTPADSTIWVRVTPEEQGVLITVEDQGAGVPAELREQIFEPFRQGPGTPAHSPGVGIGLSLVARFAELHGGRAWVEERPGGGASFKVLLPGSSYFSTGAPTNEPYSVQDPS